jgi:serine/threonine protein phosphatase PrpC
VYQWISPNDVYDIVKHEQSSQWAQKVVELALKNNSNDNCTAIVLQLNG